MPSRIETERLILTPEEPSDAEWFTELLNIRGTGTFTVADALARIDVMRKTIEATGIGALVLRKRPDGEALGYTAIVVGRGSLEEPELAYELLPRAHGHGYATEAARALLDAAFDTGRRRIWVTIGSLNAPSLRVAEKLASVATTAQRTAMKRSSGWCATADRGRVGVGVGLALDRAEVPRHVG